MDGWVGAPRQTAVLYGSWVLEWQCQSRSDHSAADSRRACFHSHVHMFTLSARKKANNLSEAFPGMFSLVKSFHFCLFCMFVFFLPIVEAQPVKRKVHQYNIAKRKIESTPNQAAAEQLHRLSYCITSSHVISSLNGAGERGRSKGRGEFKDKKGKCDWSKGRCVWPGSRQSTRALPYTPNPVTAHRSSRPT